MARTLTISTYSHQRQPHGTTPTTLPFCQNGPQASLICLNARGNSELFAYIRKAKEITLPIGHCGASLKHARHRIQLTHGSLGQTLHEYGTKKTSNIPAAAEAKAVGGGSTPFGSTTSMLYTSVWFFLNKRQLLLSLSEQLHSSTSIRLPKIPMCIL